MKFLDDTDDRARDAATIRRVARNQATLRVLNEGMDNERDHDVMAFRCECGELGCNRLVPLRRAEYEAIRAHPRRFVIAPGHVIEELEHLVERDREHAVVETHAHMSDFAEQTYPRTAG